MNSEFEHICTNMRTVFLGTLVNLDISVCYQGFHSDLNETFFIGQCNEESHQVVRGAYESLRAALPLLRPGNLYRRWQGS